MTGRSTQPDDRDGPAVRAPGRIFLATTGLSVCGTAVGILDATGATTMAGQEDNGAIYTGCFLALTLLVSGLAVPLVPAMTVRLGVVRMLVLTKALTAAAWFLAGLALLLGAPAFPTLMVAAPVFGLLTAFGTVLSPITTQAYLATSRMAAAYARLSVVSGLSWGVGALAGGLLLDLGSPGWGLIVNGLLTVPLCIVLRFVKPPIEPAVPIRNSASLRDMSHTLRTNVRLRRTTILACAVALFLAPLSSLVVPISQSLRQEPLYRGAGVLMAGMALGEVLSPQLIRRLSRHRSDLAASAIAAISTGAVLAIFGVCALLLTKRIELALWVLVAIGFGMARYASRALTIGSASESVDSNRTAAALATLFFVAGLVAPIGMLIWSALIGSVSAESAMWFGAVGITLVGVPIYLLTRRERPLV